ncbi:MAG: ATP-binding protein [Ignavibacteriales bacterium]|nr:ATP-binding protein [Ignavibacteriales bacterium]
MSIMNYRELALLLEEGEGIHLEFKRKVSSPEKIARALIGFANTKGGTILFGIDDDASIVGVESEKMEVEMIETAGNVYCDPPIEPAIEIISHKGRDVIVATIEESKEKPHYLVVDDDETGRAESPDAPPLRISIGDTERRLFDFLEANERITVKQFGKLVNISDRRASRILINLVRAGVLRIHTHEKEEFYTMSY